MIRMRINEGVAISSSKILLVPYELRHVPIYHEWMKSEEIRLATASEPLSLAEEFNMQKNWRNNHDKLTFIACKPISRLVKEITAGLQDSANQLLGDVNLFLSPAEEDPSSCVGELELMIAPLEARRKEYDSQNKANLLRLRVKINSENLKSIKLFESIGFLKAEETPNYFGELEFTMKDFTNIDQTLSFLKKYNVKGYTEVPYSDEK